MIKEARIYLKDAAKPAIVTATHRNVDGIYYEQEEAIVVPEWRVPVALATALRSALQRFSFRDRNLRDLKLTEWPAYRASRCRSVKEFQATYLSICVRAANEAELCYVAEARPIEESEISLHVTLDRHGDEEIGRRLLRLYDVCSKWSSAIA